MRFEVFMDKMEQKIAAIVDRHADELIAEGNSLFSKAERGFAEFETARTGSCRTPPSCPAMT